MACGKNCNKCTDNGCKDIVYPDCILTKIAYPCIGIGAGKTGSVLFSAINSRLCELQNREVVVQGAIQSWGSGDYQTIAVSPKIVGGVTTYELTLGPVVLEFYNTMQTIVNSTTIVVNTLTEAVDDFSAMLYDPSGGSLMDSIELSVTNLEGNVATIEACIFDGLGDCKIDALIPEEWKKIGDVGTLANGQAIPLYTKTTAGGIELSYVVTGQTNAFLRKVGTDVESYGKIRLDDYQADSSNIRQVELYTLPVGYRPTTEVFIPTTIVDYDADLTFPAFISIETSGVVKFWVYGASGPGLGLDQVAIGYYFKYQAS